MADRPAEPGNPHTDLDSQSLDSQSLDFQKADHGPAGDADLACASCGQSLPSRYYTAGGSVLCERCKFEVEAALVAGSGAARVLKAGVFGLAAAAVSAAIWMAVTELTGYEIGLVAILVGFLVGQAVAIGAGRRGGWPYQTMAVVLTYLAIVVTYVPYVFEGMLTVAEEEAVAADPGSESTPSAQPRDAAPAAAPEGPAATDSRAAAGLDGAIADPEAVDNTLPTLEDGAEESASALALLVFAAAVLAIAAAAPFLAGFENIIGILIIGIALWEAWRRNQRVEIAIEGPFEVGAVAR